MDHLSIWSFILLKAFTTKLPAGRWLSPKCPSTRLGDRSGRTSSIRGCPQLVDGAASPAGGGETSGSTHPLEALIDFLCNQVRDYQIVNQHEKLATWIGTLELMPIKSVLFLLPTIISTISDISKYIKSWHIIPRSVSRWASSGLHHPTRIVKKLIWTCRWLYQHADRILEKIPPESVRWTSQQITSTIPVTLSRPNHPNLIILSGGETANHLGMSLRLIRLSMPTSHWYKVGPPCAMSWLRSHLNDSYIYIYLPWAEGVTLVMDQLS